MLASDEEGGTLDALRFSLASEIVELVVLTGDELFLQTLREAVGSARRLWHVLSADKVSDLLVAGQVGILVLDVQALNETSAVFVAQIKRQFPDLVVVVAGNRDAEISLAALISAGTVYRFIHKPMSPGRAKSFADAAVKKYDEQRRRSAAIPPKTFEVIMHIAGRPRTFSAKGQARLPKTIFSSSSPMRKKSPWMRRLRSTRTAATCSLSSSPGWMT